MTTTFLVPFKGVRGAKSRWTLQGQQRESALLEILDHNLGTVAGVVGALSTVLVCPDVDCFARFPNLAHFRCSAGGLNGDLFQARQALSSAQQNGALAVLLPDLPKLHSSDVEAMLESSARAQVVLCPDHRRVGTNGLVLSPAFCLDFLFEGASFERHRKRAQELGRTVLVLDRPGLANYADEEDDLRRISQL